MIRSLFEDVYLQAVNNFNTAIADGNFPADGSYIDVTGFDRFAFLIRVGTLDSALTAQVKQDTGAAETASIKNITGAVATIAADDDNEWLTIEVETRRLDINNDFTHVTLAVSGQAGDNEYLDIFFVGLNPDEQPVTQPAGYGQTIKVMG